jgi:dihydrodipicolinate synthase/N-acetylneuraminate lyase
MPRFEMLTGCFGLPPTPYRENLEIHEDDLRSVVDFCCKSGQHGIVWPVMVGEFYYLGEEERIRGLDIVMEEVNGRIPVMFGCSGVSISQTVGFARAAKTAGADAVITMPPLGATSQMAMDMHKRIADAFDGPLVVQNASGQYTSLTGDEIEELLEAVPLIEYVKEERSPGPKHISEVYGRVGQRVKGIFGGAGGKNLPGEMRRGANGCMPACELADVLTKVVERWTDGDEDGARDLHRRLLPLINLENHPFMRYILKRRGVFGNTIERAPNKQPAVDDELKKEITILLKAIENDIHPDFPFGPE